MAPIRKKSALAKIDGMQGVGEERTEQYKGPSFVNKGRSLEHRSPQRSSPRFSPKRFAVFDVDGTLFRSSLLIELAEELIDSGVFEESIRDSYAKEKEAWQNRQGSYHDYISKVVEVFVKNIRGVKFDALKYAGEHVVGRFHDRMYTYTRDLVKELEAKGYYLLAVSHSPKLVLDEFCKRLGFNKVYGHIYQVGPEDRFTGEVEDLHLISNKANIVKRAAEKEGLTFKDSIGVGDTEGDIPFLELVEKPICFNPSMELYRWAKRTGAEVVVERKDVVYKV